MFTGTSVPDVTRILARFIDGGRSMFTGTTGDHRATLPTS